MARFEEQRNLQGVNTDFGGDRAIMSIAQKLEQFANTTRQTGQNISSAIGKTQAIVKSQSESRAVADAANTQIMNDQGDIYKPSFSDQTTGNTYYRSAYNSALRDRYKSAVKGDSIRKLNALAAQYPDDPDTYNQQASAMINGVVGEVDPSIATEMKEYLFDESTTLQTSITSAFMKKERDQAENDIDFEIESSIERANTAAYNGDHLGASLILAEEVTPLMYGKAERNVISPGAIEKKSESVMVDVYMNGIAGEFGRIVREESPLAAYRKLRDIKSGRPFSRDFTIAEEQRLTTMLNNEVGDYISTLDKIASIEAEELRKIQEINTQELFISMNNGEDVSLKAIDYATKGYVNSDQLKMIVERNRTVGEGRDDWSIINDITLAMDDTPLSVLNTRIMQSGLTGSTQNRLLRQAQESSSSGSFTKDPAYQEAKDYIRRMLATKGLMGNLDEEAEERIGVALRDLFESVRDGDESIWNATDRIVGTGQIDKMMKNSRNFGNTPAEVMAEITRRRQLDKDDKQYIEANVAKSIYNKMAEAQEMINAQEQYERARKKAKEEQKLNER